MTFFNVLIIIWTIAMGFIACRIYGRLLNPCFMMNLIWCVCSTGAVLGLFSFNKPSLKTYIYIFAFLLIYSVSSLLFRIMFAKRARKAPSDQIYHNMERLRDKGSFDVDVNVKLFAVILLFFILCLLPAILKAFSYFSSGDLKTLRALFLYDSQVFLGRFMSYFYNYVIRPYIIFLCILASYAIAKNFRQKWGLLVLAITGVSIHMFISAGRMLVFELGCYILIAILLYRAKEKDIIAKFHFGALQVKITKRIGLILFVSVPLIFAIIFISSLRSYTEYGIIGTFWQYAIGPMSYLDLIVNKPEMFGISTNTFLFGKATFGPLTGFFDTLLSVLVGTDYQGADYLVNQYVERFYYIAPGVRLNATATILYPFLRDWGIAGLFIGPCIIALLVEFVDHKAEATYSVAWHLARISIYYMILFSIWRYTLLYPWTYMSFFWILVFQPLNSVNFRLRFRKISGIEDNILSTSSTTVSLKQTR